MNAINRKKCPMASQCKSYNCIWEQLLFQGGIPSTTNDLRSKHHSDTHTWKVIKKRDSGYTKTMVGVMQQHNVSFPNKIQKLLPHISMCAPCTRQLPANAKGCTVILWKSSVIEGSVRGKLIGAYYIYPIPKKNINSLCHELQIFFTYFLLGMYYYYSGMACFKKSMPSSQLNVRNSFYDSPFIQPISLITRCYASQVKLFHYLKMFSFFFMGSVYPRSYCAVNINTLKPKFN